MHFVHTTREGKNLFISQLDDEHLFNTILMHVRKIKEISNMLSEEAAKVSKLSAALYDINPEQMAVQAKRELPRAVTVLYPYLAEAVLRNLRMDEISAAMQDAFQRKGQDVLTPLPDGRGQSIQMLAETLEHSSFDEEDLPVQ